MKMVGSCCYKGMMKEDEEGPAISKDWIQEGVSDGMVKGDKWKFLE